jgi:hypothetical protein
MLPFAVPGGMEIGIILLIFVLPLLFVIGVLMLFRDLFGSQKVKEDRFQALEERVADLEAEVGVETESEAEDEE